MYYKENEKMSLRFVVLLDCCTQYLLTRTVMCYFTWDHKPLQCMDNTEGYKT